MSSFSWLLKIFGVKLEGAMTAYLIIMSVYLFCADNCMDSNVLPCVSNLLIHFTALFVSVYVIFMFISCHFHLCHWTNIVCSPPLDSSCTCNIQTASPFNCEYDLAQACLVINLDNSLWLTKTLMTLLITNFT